MSRFQFVADNSDHFAARGGVKRLCELVEIERSSYYAWLAAAPARAARARADADLAASTRAVHAADNTIGAPRMTAELNDQLAAQALLVTVLGATVLDDKLDEADPDDSPDGAGLDDGLDDGLDGDGELVGSSGRLNHKRVARVMREHGIRGYQRRRRVRTTIPEPSGHKVPDLLAHDFTAPAPNQRYVGDSTYLPLGRRDEPVPGHRDRLLLPPARGLGRRRPHADQPRPGRPPRGRVDPRRRRRPGRGDLPPDHGSDYTSKDYASLGARLGVTQSMGAVGTSADNALAESFNATLKREVLQDAATWTDEPTCRRQIFRWLVRYHLHRRHSWCRYQSPSTYEATWAATLPTTA